MVVYNRPVVSVGRVETTVTVGRPFYYRSHKLCVMSEDGYETLISSSLAKSRSMATKPSVLSTLCSLIIKKWMLDLVILLVYSTCSVTCVLPGLSSQLLSPQSNPGASPGGG